MSIGGYIDERLSWADHIDYLSKKISSAIGGRRLVRPFYFDWESMLTQLIY